MKFFVIISIALCALRASAQISEAAKELQAELVSFSEKQAAIANEQNAILNNKTKESMQDYYDSYEKLRDQFSVLTQNLTMGKKLASTLMSLTMNAHVAEVFLDVTTGTTRNKIIGASGAAATVLSATGGAIFNVLFLAIDLKPELISCWNSSKGDILGELDNVYTKPYAAIVSKTVNELSTELHDLASRADATFARVERGITACQGNIACLDAFVSKFAIF
jgi:hypothetical protein